MRIGMDASIEAKSPQEHRTENRRISRPLAWLLLCAGLGCFGSARLSAQDSAPGYWQIYLIRNGWTVYDVVNQVTWLADANLARAFRFGLPLCETSSEVPCVNTSGSMNYGSATAWVAAMNAANYLGHSNWQLPTTPMTDTTCEGKPGKMGNSFGFGCAGNALGYLYYTALGFKAPNTAVPIPFDIVWPFVNFQPGLYWSNTPGKGSNEGIAVFSFATGAQGGSTPDDYLSLLPMIQGKIPGTPPSYGMGLQINPGWQTVYDPVAEVTWLADANLAANVKLGLPPCQTPTTPTPWCIAQDGTMDHASAGQFIINMNAYDNGAGYLGQTNWQIPPVPPTCPTYNCTGMSNPMGNLFYTQLHFTAGNPVVEAPDIPVGPFYHVQPSQYWTCEAPTIQSPCGSSGAGSGGAEFGFSFGDGYLGTTGAPADHLVTVYYVGCDLPDQRQCTMVPF
jgi:hypothetical protein